MTAANAAFGSAIAACAAWPSHGINAYPVAQFVTISSIRLPRTQNSRESNSPAADATINTHTPTSASAVTLIGMLGSI